jgi:hypothetical protein
VPQRPRDGADEDGEQHESAKTSGNPGDAGHAGNARGSARDAEPLLSWRTRPMGVSGHLDTDRRFAGIPDRSLLYMADAPLS